MINESDKKLIQELSKKIPCKTSIAFWPGTDPTKESRDIDIAVEGINPMDFFDYYGDLLLKLSKPVDVIDLSEVSKFVTLVRKEGVPIYG